MLVWHKKSNDMIEKITSVDDLEKCSISCDSLVAFHVKRGAQMSVLFYCILGIFSKHYNKWFILWDEDKVEVDNPQRILKW